MTFEHTVMIDFDQFEVTIGGHKVSGWSQEYDALMVPNALELTTGMKVATDSFSSSTYDYGPTVSIRLLINSPSTAFFMQAAASMLDKRAEDKHTEVIYWNGTVENKSQNYKLILNRGVMIKISPLMPTTDTSIKFDFVFQEIIPDYPDREYLDKGSNP